MQSKNLSPTKRELEIILEKCLHSERAVDRILSERSLRFLITEELSDEDFIKVSKSLEFAKNKLKALSAVLKEIGVPDLEGSKETLSYLDKQFERVEKTSSELDKLDQEEGKIKSWWGKTVSLSGYLKEALAIQNETDRFCDALAVGLDSLKNKELLKITKDNKDLDEKKSLSELLESQNPQAIQKIQANLVRKIREKFDKEEKGLWAAIKSFFSSKDKPAEKLFVDFAATLTKIPIAKLKEMKLDKISQIGDESPEAEDVAEDLAAEEKGVAGKKGKTAAAGSEAGKSGEEAVGADSSKKQKEFKPEHLASLKKINDELFPDEKNPTKRKTKFKELLKNAGIIDESRNRTRTHEDEQIERWQKIAGIK